MSALQGCWRDGRLLSSRSQGTRSANRVWALIGPRRSARLPKDIAKSSLMIASDVVLGSNVRIFQPDLVNLYGCLIGDNVRIGAFVEIQKGVRVGNDCKISSHSFLCEGVSLEDRVFIGHGVMFINDLYPQATNPDGSLQQETDWK